MVNSPMTMDCKPFLTIFRESAFAAGKVAAAFVKLGGQGGNLVVQKGHGERNGGVAAENRTLETFDFDFDFKTFFL